MGSSRLADALTGLSIPRGDPVVALAVVRRTGGYPDATTHAANAPLSPSNAFEPVSLPIRAKAGDYGDIEPNRDDLGARLLLDLANKPSWDELAAEGFGYKGSILLGAAARGEARNHVGFPVDKDPRVLGLVVFGEESWKRVVRLGSQGLSRPKDIATVLEALAKLRAADAAGATDTLGMNMDLTRLAASALHENDPTEADGIRTTRLPILARALSHREDGDLVSGVATEWLRRSHVLGTSLFRHEPGPDTVKAIAMVWDLQAAERGMDALCRTWQPSYGAGQHDNAHEIAGNALDSLAEAALRMLGRIEEGMADEERDVPRLDALLQRMDEIRSALVDRLVAARDEPPTP